MLWQSALSKYRKRANIWDATQIGLSCTIKMYNVFTLPVLSYISQLTEPPAEAYQAEKTTLRHLSHGPGNWCTLQDLWYLSEIFAFPIIFESIRNMSLELSCALRPVRRHMAATHGMLNTEQRS